MKEAVKRTRNLWFTLLFNVMICAIPFVLMRVALVSYQLQGPAMEPALAEDTHLMVNRSAYWFNTPERGDVVVFVYPYDGQGNKHYLKRIIGLPGETIECLPNEIKINGEPLDEPWNPNPWNYVCEPITLDADEYFVLGDNCPNSSDSHQWGPLPKEFLIGKAELIYFPTDSIGWVP